MIFYLSGSLIKKKISFIILDVNGIGYYINISLNTFSKLPNEGKIKIYIYIVINENEYSLYGFYNEKEREIFINLISVNGVGSNIAILILSNLDYYQIYNAIIKKEINTFKKIKGIGNKIGERIILELKDKILLKLNNENSINDNSILEIKKRKIDTIKALKSLGFNKKNIEKTIDDILQDKINIPIEEFIKEVIKKI